jgi:hypothetical protein
MGSALLFSVLLATVIIPVRAARDENPRRGLRKAIIQTLIFQFFWVLALAYEYPRIWH